MPRGRRPSGAARERPRGDRVAELCEERRSLLLLRKFIPQDAERLRAINARLAQIATMIAGALPVADMVGEVGITMVG
jgi:hypothetical protein